MYLIRKWPLLHKLISGYTRWGVIGDAIMLPNLFVHLEIDIDVCVTACEYHIESLIKSSKHELGDVFLMYIWLNKSVKMTVQVKTPAIEATRSINRFQCFGKGLGRFLQPQLKLPSKSQWEKITSSTNNLHYIDLARGILFSLLSFRCHITIVGFISIVHWTIEVCVHWMFIHSFMLKRLILEESFCVQTCVSLLLMD